MECNFSGGRFQKSSGAKSELKRVVLSTSEVVERCWTSHWHCISSWRCQTNNKTIDQKTTVKTQELGKFYSTGVRRLEFVIANLLFHHDLRIFLAASPVLLPTWTSPSQPFFTANTANADLPATKMRKVSGRWTDREKYAFEDGLKKYGRGKRQKKNRRQKNHLLQQPKNIYIKSFLVVVRYLPKHGFSSRTTTFLFVLCRPSSDLFSMVAPFFSSVFPPDANRQLETFYPVDSH